jgi:hypothetical protein
MYSSLISYYVFLLSRCILVLIWFVIPLFGWSKFKYVYACDFPYRLEEMADVDEWRSFTIQHWLRSPTPKPRYVEFFLQEDDGKPKLLWERFIQPFCKSYIYWS